MLYLGMVITVVSATLLRMWARGRGDTWMLYAAALGYSTENVIWFRHLGRGGHAIRDGEMWSLCCSVTLIFVSVYLGERLTTRQWVGIALSYVAGWLISHDA